jgi:hypothetical protein
MLKIWSMVRLRRSSLSCALGCPAANCGGHLQKKEQQKAENDANAAAGGKKKKVTAAQLRVQKGACSQSMEDSQQLG